MTKTTFKVGPVNLDNLQASGLLGLRGGVTITRLQTSCFLYCPRPRGDPKLGAHLIHLLPQSAPGPAPHQETAAFLE